MVSKELEKTLKKLKKLSMKDPSSKLLHKLIEIEPATLTELAGDYVEDRNKTLKIINGLIKINILSVIQTPANKLIVKTKKR